MKHRITVVSSPGHSKLLHRNDIAAAISGILLVIDQDQRPGIYAVAEALGLRIEAKDEPAEHIT